MVYRIQFESERFLHLGFIGDTDRGSAEALRADLTPILAQVTPEKPLLILWDDTRGGRANVDARKLYADLNRDPRIGKVAIFGVRYRYGRLIGEFVLKFTGRDNIRFFDNETEARAWLTA